MSSGSDTTEFLTTKEVAELLRIKERKLYDLVSAQEIPCVKATGKLLFPKTELLHWIRTGELMSTNKNHARLNVLAGSHDPLLEWAIRESGCGLAMQFDGSLSGLDVFEKVVQTTLCGTPSNQNFPVVWAQSQGQIAWPRLANLALHRLFRWPPQQWCRFRFGRFPRFSTRPNQGHAHAEGARTKSCRPRQPGVWQFSTQANQPRC